MNNIKSDIKKQQDYFRQISLMNVSITTNRTCTLKCKHCYIKPELFLDKSQMSKEDFKLVFDKVEEILDLDKRLLAVEWEVIGGETTMMPFEWWEEMLPYALKRIDDINKKTGRIGSLNFLTNLIYKDKRYTDLFNKYGDNELFNLYTSYEPDTNRFGNNDKMLPQFLRTLSEIKVKHKILDIIMTREVINMGAKNITDLFSEYGITDYSIKNLSPYGSGKEFFKFNMTSFDKMADFLLDFQRILKNTGVSNTPKEEILGALNDARSFQCNGNFKYDLSIEPDGLTHFNANQTMDERAEGFKDIYLNQEDWAERVLIENKTEELNKVTLKHDSCHQCEYLRYCNGGWYHYKLLDQKVISRFNQNECSGYRKVWDDIKNEYFSNDIISLYPKPSREVRAARGSEQVLYLDESEINNSNYDEYLNILSKLKDVRMSHKVLFGKSITERALIYEDLSLNYELPTLKDENDLDIINHVITRHLKPVSINSENFINLIKKYKDTNKDMGIIYECYLDIKEFTEGINITDKSLRIFDERNTEIYTTLFLVFFTEKMKHFSSYNTNDNNKKYFFLLNKFRLNASINKEIRNF